MTPFCLSDSPSIRTVCREFGKRNPYFIFKIEYCDDTLLPF
nr:MAG TPA: hypothetical protein [Microviridae sp.]